MAETFRIGLTGLNAATSDLSVTANNIANANTTGFKYSRAEFSDIFSTSALGQATRRTVGSGVQLAAVTQQFKQGNINATGNPLDIAIDGEGFFKIQAENGTISYTRAGTFGLNSEGYVVTSTGSKLQGFPADVDGNIVVGAAQSMLLQTADIQPRQTSDLEFGINLDAAADAIDSSITPFDPTDPKTYNYTTSATIYDSLGGSHTLSTFFVKNPLSGASGNTQSNWTVYGTLDGIFEVPTDPSQPVSNANPLVPAINFGGRPTQMVAQANSTNQTLVQSVDNTPASTNLGLLSTVTTIINANDPSLPTPERIYFTSPTTYEIRDASGNSLNPQVTRAFSSGSPIQHNGWQAVVVGTPASGDYIDIEPQIDFSSHATSTIVDAGDPTVKANWQVHFTGTAGSAATGYEIRDAAGNSLSPQVTGTFTSSGTSVASSITYGGWSLDVTGTAYTGDVYKVSPTSGSMQLTFDDHGLLDQSVVSQLTPRDISIQVQAVEGVLGKPTSATEPLQLSLDFLTATQFGGQSSTNNLVQDGYASGTLVGVNVSDSGIMFGRYTNGQSKVLGQVALFNFRNVQGLSPVGDTAWAETSASGQPISGPPGSARLGLIRGGALEGSNVEMSDQLVNMIQAQRNFQANAQVIQTADQLTQTLLQIR